MSSFALGINYKKGETTEKQAADVNKSSNGSPFSITCIRSPLPYLEHLITLLLPTFTLNFLLSHTFFVMVENAELINSAKLKNNFSYSLQCIEGTHFSQLPSLCL